MNGLIQELEEQIARLREEAEVSEVLKRTRDEELRVVAKQLSAERAVSAAALAGEQRAIQQRDEARAEVERLDILADKYRVTAAGLMEERDDARAEVERLRAGVEALRLAHELEKRAHERTWQLKAKAQDALKSVAERQRAKCAEWVNAWDVGPADHPAHAMEWSLDVVRAAPLVTEDEP